MLIVIDITTTKMRYEEIPNKIDENGRRVVRTTLYPPIPRKESDVYVRTTPGDRVDLLAHQYYGDVSKWWLIAEANAVGKGTFAILPGTLLRIPKQYDDVLQEYERLNK
jgi:nucleoid-associated protein YgaU